MPQQKKVAYGKEKSVEACHTAVLCQTNVEKMNVVLSACACVRPRLKDHYPATKMPGIARA